MTGRAETAEQRRRIHGALARRNRLVAILRLGVPAIGGLVLVVLVVQILLLGLAGEFGISRIAVDRERIVVDTPRYDGVMADGTVYHVTAKAAAAAFETPELIDLSEARVELDRAVGPDMAIRAAAARFGTIDQHVTVDGIADVEDATGTTGTIVGMFIDWPRQSMSASGAVHFDYASGMTLDATGMAYDPATALWTFSRATVTLPSTPGEDP